MHCDDSITDTEPCCAAAQNVGSASVAFCLSEFSITGGSPPSRTLAGVSASAQGDYPGAVTPLTSTVDL